MKLTNIEPNTGITIYVYNKGQMTIPNEIAVYGSDSKWFRPVDLTPYTNYEYYYRITQHELLALDKPARRCNDVLRNLPSVSQCIAEYFEARFNCSLYLLESLGQRDVCIKNNVSLSFVDDWENQEVMELYNNISSHFHEWEIKTEWEIYKATGCMPSCKRKQIRLEKEHEISSKTYTDDPRIKLVFYYRDGMYNINEEYFVYDYGNFVADIGGYLGLLLGHSMFSVYTMSANWITNPIRTVGNQISQGGMKKKEEM